MLFVISNKVEQARGKCSWLETERIQEVAHMLFVTSNEFSNELEETRGKFR